MVWNTGTLRAASFGTEVYGVGAGCLKWTRSTATRMLPGGGQGVLQAAVLGLRGEHDPARKVLLAPITRYHEELWLVSDPGLWHSRHLRPGELLQGSRVLQRKTN